MKIQAETKEWVITEDGQLVQVAATKKHSKMDDDQVTDYLPNSYVFSNAKYMELHKDDFEDEVIDEKFPRYLEGKKPELYKKTTFADRYFKADKETPAKIISNIRRAHPVITDEEQTFNPFIQRANDMNKEYRQPAIETIMKVSEFIKPDMGDGTEVYADNEKNPQRFYYGGYTRKNPPKAFLGLNALFDAFSNKRNKKEYNRDLASELAQGEAYGTRQRGHVDDQLASSSIGAMSNFLPTERKEDLNLSEQKSIASSEGDRYARRLQGSSEQQRNESLSNAYSLGRYSPGNSGAMGSLMSNAIGSANQIGYNSSASIADMDQRTGMAIGDMSREEQMDRIANKYNYDSLKRQNTVGGIQGLADAKTAASSAYASLDPYAIRKMIEDREYRKYMEKKAMSQANNQRYTDSIMDTVKAATSVATMGMG